MRAVLIESFGVTPVVTDVPEPTPTRDGVVVRVQATGLCRSDFHAFSGHDDGVTLPHVPGHELVGVVTEVGPDVRRVRVGDRITTPFVCGCGACDECRAGNAQVCPNQEQPGFTHAGSFAELVEVRHADVNAVTVPGSADAAGAALLGCRLATSFRALAQAGTGPGDTVLVIGCGGVGLSAVMIARALGAEVVAVDLDAAALRRATELGAGHAVGIAGLSPDDARDAVRAATGGDGASVAVEGIGNESALALGLRSLRRRGTLVQVGLFAAEPRVPVPDMIARELRLIGSHGMAAADYPAMMAMVADGRLHPERLVSRRITLDEAPAALAGLDGHAADGVAVITF
ncbi:alcohol dehydrogenase [Pseudonocardia sediminis]|uniref:Alcohol dehydrogenase n=1 Tax=Pseudonocardia sediminis TaxID=1397368 RepID=A0A4Q7UUG1_PSEST|nr:alcohol dehydrogenase catalytic domain-containing protein [Pseudonocardia sediminis]RZT85385.1 alcohol dehydrogenase [Pseudonocardia sediminis]